MATKNATSLSKTNVSSLLVGGCVHDQNGKQNAPQGGGSPQSGNARKLAAAIIVALLLAIAGVFAYLTATDTATNRFSLASKIDIEVLEPNWVEANGQNVLPTQTVTKDPYIHNKTGNSAWVFADVVIPTASIITANAEGVPANDAALTELFAYDMPSGTKWQLIDVLDGADTRTFRYAWTEVVDGNGNTGNLFDEVTACNYVDGQIPVGLNAKEIVVNGYAIQSKGFVDDTEHNVPGWALAWLAYVGENTDLGAANNLMLETTSVYDGTGDAVFRSYAPLSSLVGVQMDGVSVDEENYVATEGSTVITFHDNYLASLEPGHHTVTINNGTEYDSVSANLEIVPASSTGGSEPATPTVICTSCGQAGHKNLLDENCPNHVAPATLATQYQAAYNVAATGQKGYFSGDEVIWWMNSDNEIHIAPANGESGTMVIRWTTKSPFDSVKSTATSVIVEPGVVAGKILKYMFASCSSITSINLSNFDTSNVTDMYGMFHACTSLTSLNLSNFDTSNVTDMSGIFAYCQSLTSIDLSNFDTSEVTDISGMFGGCKSLTSLNLSNFNTSKVTDMSGMFNDCKSLTSVSLSNFNTSKVTSMNNMFSNCSQLTSLNLSNFDTSNVTNMSNMFGTCSQLTSLNLSNCDTSNVTDMSNMFYNCSQLTSLNLSNFDTSNVTNMYCMFANCSSLTSLTGLSSWNTSNVTNMNNMFQNCSSLTSLDLSNFNTSKVTLMSCMFAYCSCLTSLDGLSNWNVSNVTNMSDMFYNVPTSVTRPSWYSK